MKIYTTLLAITFASLSIAKPAYHVRTFAQVPFPYRSLFGLRPIKRCFENNILTMCKTSSQTPYKRLVTKNYRNRYNFSFSEILNNEKIYKENALYAQHKTLGLLASPIVRPQNNINLKMDKPNVITAINSVPMLMPVSSFGIGAVDTSTVKIQTMRNISKTAEIVDELSKETDTVEIATEAVMTENTWSDEIKLNTMETSLEKIDSATKDYSVFAADNVIRRNDSFSPTTNDSLTFALDQFERKLYVINFDKFLNLTPASKGDSGMSFVQSGLFLGMTLMALSTETDVDTMNEINNNFGLNVSKSDKIKLVNQVMSSLPNVSDELKFRWSSRLVLRSGWQLSQEFSRMAEALQLKIDYFEDQQAPAAMARLLNTMIEKDSDGAIRNTFEEDDLTTNEEAVLITTLYLRARWRSAPTLLNGTMPFRVTGNTPSRTIRMIRINDIMKYVDLPECDAEAIEISYLSQGLSLLMLVPRGNSLRRLVEHVESVNLTSITKRMQNMRIAVSLPLYTLRMTLLLPSKLQAMGISRLLDANSSTENFPPSLRISQAVQRIMFWAEAGRNAYKDDGLEWDAVPEMKIIVDRPYMFCVRWQNMNIMLGNFVL